MPELPEVETIRAGLAKLLPAKQVKDVWYDWDKSVPNAPADVARFLVGARVEKIRRRAKVLIIELSSGWALIIHLKMTGQLVFVPKAQKQVTGYSEQFTAEEKFGGGHPSKSLTGQVLDKSTRVVLDFTDGSKLYFDDQGKFGWMRLLPTIEIPEIDFFKKVESRYIYYI